MAIVVAGTVFPGRVVAAPKKLPKAAPKTVAPAKPKPAVVERTAEEPRPVVSPEAKAKAQALYEEGMIPRQAGKGEEALAKFLEAHKADPLNLSVLEVLGDLHSERGQPAEAAKYFGLYLRWGPDRSEIRQRRGNMLYRGLQYKEAAEEFERVRQALPENGSALFALAKCYGRLGAKAKLLEVVPQVLARAPHYKSLLTRDDAFKAFQADAEFLKLLTP